jgi:hypothetical protein
MGILALYYARKGGLSRGLDLITRARSIDPKNNQLLYNEAIIQALSKHNDPALKALAICVKNGYPKGIVKHEPDLAPLYKTPEFIALVK